MKGATEIVVAPTGLTEARDRQFGVRRQDLNPEPAD